MPREKKNRDALVGKNNLGVLFILFLHIRWGPYDAPDTLSRAFKHVLFPLMFVA